MAQAAEEEQMMLDSRWHGFHLVDPAKTEVRSIFGMTRPHLLLQVGKLLRAGLSNKEIALQLKVDQTRTVKKFRLKLEAIGVQFKCACGQAGDHVGFCKPRRVRNPGKRRDACMHGHLLIGGNVYVHPTKGWRRCRTCLRGYDKKTYKQKNTKKRKVIQPKRKKKPDPRWLQYLAALPFEVGTRS